MAPIVQKHLAEIRALCTKYKMNRVWLFGSALDSISFRETSDIDFLYEPAKELMTVREFLDNPLKIKQELAALLDRQIDWVRYLSFRNPYFREEVESTKELIFEHESKSKEIPV